MECPSPYAHEVSWLVSGKKVGAERDDPPEDVLFFPSTQSANGVAGQVSLDQCWERRVQGFS